MNAFPFSLIYDLLSSLGDSIFGVLFTQTALKFGNIGIMLSLTFGAMILLRPVTNRLIAPRWRVWVWFAGWYCGFLIPIYGYIGRITLLPTSFRSLVVPRTFHAEDKMPGFLPDVVRAGDYTIAFPGGAELPIHISSALLGAIGLIWCGTLVGVIVWDHRQSKRLRQIMRQGVKMDEDQRAKFGIERSSVVVRLCKDLPTSFVRFGNDEHFGDGTRFVICIQDDLPEERMRLVLLHEMEHLNQFHVWWKSTITAVLYILWWNPVLWAAYRLTCLDMELACDEAVMTKLDEHDRREYARTLVDLGAGKPMWGAMNCFGECDAVLRVRRVVSWKPRTRVNDARSILLTVAMVLFFYCGSSDMVFAQEFTQSLNWISYANGSHFETDFQAMRGADLEIEEVWERRESGRDDEHTLLVRDQNGEWYVCCCAPNSEGGYRITSMGPGYEPNLEGAAGIRIPGDKLP